MGVYQVSHDGRWLILGHDRSGDSQNSGTDLLVTDSDGQILETIPWDDSKWSFNIQGWLSNDQGLIIVPRDGGDNIITFNPFTQEEQRIPPSFGYSSRPPSSDENWGGINVAYDPSLSRVLYLDASTTLILWDTLNKRELWRLTDNYASLVLPQWSPDGKYVAIMTSVKEGNSELSILSRNGDERLSVLVIKYPVWDYNWSPNGQYLTYWIPNAQGRGERLLIFNLITKKRLIICLQPPPDPTFSSARTAPIWSPDSKQFIIGFSEPRTDVNAKWVYHSLIINVEQEQVAKLNAVTLEPVAWIKTKP